MDLKGWLPLGTALQALPRALRAVVGMVLTLLITSLPLGSPAWAALPPGNAVTDPAAILRDALPIQQGDLQELQHRLESTSDDLRAKRWSALAGTVRRSQTLLNTRSAAIRASLPARAPPAAWLRRTWTTTGGSTRKGTAMQCKCARGRCRHCKHMYEIGGLGSGDLPGK